jgi:HAE1 family hydrophobic/amphiphilic exporter-1/multidrug efflux pump
LLLAIQSKSKSLLELSDYAENVLQQRFQTINDVSGINILGQKRYAMRLWLKPDLMNSHNISFTDLQTSFS